MIIKDFDKFIDFLIEECNYAFEHQDRDYLKQMILNYREVEE